jgi:hypothetical protein
MIWEVATNEGLNLWQWTVLPLLNVSDRWASTHPPTPFYSTSHSAKAGQAFPPLCPLPETNMYTFMWT